MTYQVVNINNAKKWVDFFKLPKQIYQDDSNWVAPIESSTKALLHPKKNPYFHHGKIEFFLCYLDDRIVARTVVVINYEHWQRWGKKVAFFGFFEAFDDEQAVQVLMKAAQKFAHDQGATSIEGPFNPNHYNELGLLVKNFEDPPLFFETYNPRYYPQLLEKAGFRQSKRLHTRINRDLKTFAETNFPDFKGPKNQRGFQIRVIRRKQLKEELELIRNINNDAFSDNWHFLPLSAAEYQFSSKNLLWATYPNLILLIEKGEETIGVLQLMLNINPLLAPCYGKIGLGGLIRLLTQRKKIKELVIHAVGIKKAYQHSYAIKLFVDRLLQLSKDYLVLSTSWMTEDNKEAGKAADILGLQAYKWFGIYEKKLNSNYAV